MTDERVDDPSIKDDDGLLRRVPNQPSMFKIDKNTNKKRLSSVCFRDNATKNREVSVTLEQPLLESGKTHDDALNGFENFGLARIKAGFVRHGLSQPQIVAKDPTPEDPHHGLVIGEKSKKTLSAIASSAEILIACENLD